MRRTLFYLPHEIAGIPLFGWGWMLGLWLLVSAVILVRAARQRGWKEELRAQLPMILLVAAVIVFVIPRVEQPMHDTRLTFPPVSAESGVPIRGYGVMLLALDGHTDTAARAVAYLREQRIDVEVLGYVASHA